MSSIERKYCLISSSYLAGLFDIFRLLYIWQNCVFWWLYQWGHFVMLIWGIWISLAFNLEHIWNKRTITFVFEQSWIFKLTNGRNCLSKVEREQWFSRIPSFKTHSHFLSMNTNNTVWPRKPEAYKYGNELNWSLSQFGW